MEQEVKHAFYAPSNLKIILECPGSIVLADALYKQSVLVKGEPSEAAQHGTMLHSYVPRAWNSFDCLQELELDDRAYVKDAINYLNVLIKSLGHNNFQLFFEKKVSLKHWGLPDVWGTCDIILVDNVTRTIHIVDWKFGSGVAVYAFDNPQLKAYAAGSSLDVLVKNFEVHIVQPPIDNYTSEKIPYIDLFKWVHETLAVGISRCMQPNPPFIPGEEQCRWCPVKNYCDTRFAWAQEEAQRLFEAHKLLPTKLTPRAMMDLLDKAPLVERVIKDIKAFMFQEVQRGNTEFNRYKLVRGRANRRWKNENKAIEFFDTDEAGICVDDMFKSKLISPAQAEKLNSQLKKDPKFQELYEKPEGKLALVPTSDRRPAVEPERRAVDIFAKFKVPEQLD